MTPLRTEVRTLPGMTLLGTARTLLRTEETTSGVTALLGMAVMTLTKEEMTSVGTRPVGIALMALASDESTCVVAADGMMSVGTTTVGTAIVALPNKELTTLPGRVLVGTARMSLMTEVTTSGVTSLRVTAVITLTREERTSVGTTLAGIAVIASTREVRICVAASDGLSTVGNVAVGTVLVAPSKMEVSVLPGSTLVGTARMSLKIEETTAGPTAPVVAAVISLSREEIIEVGPRSVGTELRALASEVRACVGSTGLIIPVATGSHVAMTETSLSSEETTLGLMTSVGSVVIALITEPTTSVAGRDVAMAEMSLTNEVTMLGSRSLDGRAVTSSITELSKPVAGASVLTAVTTSTMDEITLGASICVGMAAISEKIDGMALLAGTSDGMFTMSLRMEVAITGSRTVEGKAVISLTRAERTVLAGMAVSMFATPLVAAPTSLIREETTPGSRTLDGKPVISASIEDSALVTGTSLERFVISAIIEDATLGSITSVAIAAISLAKDVKAAVPGSAAVTRGSRPLVAATTSLTKDDMILGSATSDGNAVISASIEDRALVTGTSLGRSVTSAIIEDTNLGSMASVGIAASSLIKDVRAAVPGRAVVTGLRSLVATAMSLTNDAMILESATSEGKAVISARMDDRMLVAGVSLGSAVRSFIKLDTTPAPMTVVGSALISLKRDDSMLEAGLVTSPTIDVTTPVATTSEATSSIPERTEEISAGATREVGIPAMSLATEEMNPRSSEGRVVIPFRSDEMMLVGAGRAVIASTKSEIGSAVGSVIPTVAVAPRPTSSPVRSAVKEVTSPRSDVMALPGMIEVGMAATLLINEDISSEPRDGKASISPTKEDITPVGAGNAVIASTRDDITLMTGRSILVNGRLGTKEVTSFTREDKAFAGTTAVGIATISLINEEIALGSTTSVGRELISPRRDVMMLLGAGKTVTSSTNEDRRLGTATAIPVNTGGRLPPIDVISAITDEIALSGTNDVGNAAISETMDEIALGLIAEVGKAVTSLRSEESTLVGAASPLTASAKEERMLGTGSVVATPTNEVI